MWIIQCVAVTGEALAERHVSQPYKLHDVVSMQVSRPGCMSHFVVLEAKNRTPVGTFVPTFPIGQDMTVTRGDEVYFTLKNES